MLCRAVIAVLHGEVHDPSAVAKEETYPICETLLGRCVPIVVFEPRARQHVAISAVPVARDKNRLLADVHWSELLTEPARDIGLELWQTIFSSARIPVLEKLILVCGEGLGVVVECRIKSDYHINVTVTVHVSVICV
jgi:hypothetical protein